MGFMGALDMQIIYCYVRETVDASPRILQCTCPTTMCHLWGLRLCGVMIIFCHHNCSERCMWLYWDPHPSWRLTHRPILINTRSWKIDAGHKDIAHTAIYELELHVHMRRLSKVKEMMIVHKYPFQNHSKNTFNPVLLWSSY